MDYETLLKRARDCETLAKTASDRSIREKCVELAEHFRKVAEEVRLQKAA